MIEITFLKALMLIKQVNQFNNFHYWYFLDKRFKFQLEFCNGCHDLLMVSMNLNSIASLSIIGASYHCNK